MLIGVDIGGTNLRVGVIDGHKVIDEHRIQADFSLLCEELPPAKALEAIHATLGDALQTALDRYPEISAIGIGFPGFIDPVTSVVSQSPNLPGLRDIDLVTPLQARLGLPVIVENDALAAAYGEFVLAELNVGGLIFLGLGTGVGGGLIYRSEPFPGEHGVAMEVGHIIVEPGGRPCGCGNAGCMEQYSSASGVAKSYFQATGTELEAFDIAQRARQGDAAAQDAYELAGDRLAQALAHILKVVDVANVVIGGGMCGAWDLMQSSFDRRLDADLIPALRGRINIYASHASDQAGMLGAAMLAVRHVPV